MKNTNILFLNAIVKAAKTNQYGKPEMLVDNNIPKMPCEEAIKAASNFDELFDAVPICLGAKAFIIPGGSRALDQHANAGFDMYPRWLMAFTRKLSALWSSLIGNPIPGSSYLNFWSLFCSPAFQDAFVKIITKVINIIRGTGSFGGGQLAINQFISTIAGVLASTFPGIPEAGRFFIYFMELAVDNDMNTMRNTIKALCDHISRARDMGNAFAEETAKHLVDQLIFLMGAVAGGVVLGVNYIRDISKAILNWLTAHPGETLTIAAIVALAAVIIWGTGGLGAPAVPEMAAAVLAVATALGIIHDFTQADIERMITQSQGA